MTRTEFLKKLIGLSSASVFVPLFLSDDLAASQDDVIPVSVCIIPSLILLDSEHQFYSIVIFPANCHFDDVLVSSVRCSGAPALKAYPKDRVIIFVYNISALSADLQSVFSVSFTVSGRFKDGTEFEGSDTVACIRKSECLVYHTSTRSGSACNACRGHSANKIFSTEAAVTRPHRGCNCRVVQEIIYWQDYVLAFWPTSKGGSEVYDKRWGWPPPLPKGLRLRDCQ